MINILNIYSTRVKKKREEVIEVEKMFLHDFEEFCSTGIKLHQQEKEKRMRRQEEKEMRRERELEKMSYGEWMGSKDSAAIHPFIQALHSRLIRMLLFR